MIEVYYSKKFLKMFKVLDADLQDRVEEKIEQLKSRRNHKALEVHGLSEKFKGSYSFSVDRKNRVLFEYIHSKKGVVLLTAGSHDVYK